MCEQRPHLRFEYRRVAVTRGRQRSACFNGWRNAGETLLDIGGLNVSKSSTAQLGFINITDEIKGFQLGFINIAKNGFLPIFPFFNFAKDARDK